MAYRFNNGRGGVTCDHCNLLIDQDLSFAEYNEYYGGGSPLGHDGDFCVSCANRGGKEKKHKKQKEPNDLETK